MFVTQNKQMDSKEITFQKLSQIHKIFEGLAQVQVVATMDVGGLVQDPIPTTSKTQWL